MATIGIDLGTTYSCVAAFISDKVKIIPNAVGSNTTPSVVVFKEDDEIIVGEVALSEGVHEPRNTIFDIKRLIGKKFNDPKIQEYSKIWPFQILDQNGEVAVVVEGKNYSFVSTQILRYLREQAGTILNADVKRAVVTVPSYFNENQRSITKDACKDAGLEILQLITEPTAAAISYYCELGKIEGERTCLIFDLGGSALDIAFVTFKDKHIKILKIGGDPNLGGEDFDNAMVQYCIEEFKEKYQIELRGPQGSLIAVKLQKVRRLKMECQKQKCFLSSVKRVVVRLNKFHGELDLVVPITRESFEEMNETKFQRCLTLVKQIIEECGLRKEEIDDIVLVGGSTRIPRVQQLLTEYFGKRLTKNINGDEAVAFGAAMQAHYLANAESKEGATLNPVIEHLDFQMSEDNLEIQSKIQKDCGNCAQKFESRLGEFKESNDELHHEVETLRKDLSMEREKFASSVTILEEKMEILLNRLEKEIYVKNIPSGLLSFQNTQGYAMAVVLKNSTSTHFFHPKKFVFWERTREYLPMPPEIPPFYEHGFGFTRTNDGKGLGGLFSFQIDETRLVALYREGSGFNSLGLAFVPSNHPVNKNLYYEIRDGADWSKSPEKCKVHVEQSKTVGGKNDNIEARLRFGRIRAEGTKIIGEKSVLNVEIKTISE